MKQRILAVDDDPLIREITSEILEDAFDLKLACNGEEALTKAELFRPDLVLLDIVMPGMDGYATCEQFKQRHPFTKVILVSGNVQPTERLRGYACGADDYVTKPFDPSELLAKVKVFLRLSFAEEVSEMKSNLITLLAHETLTPLTWILSSAQLLRTGSTQAHGQDQDQDNAELLEIILRGAERLHTIFEKSMLLFHEQAKKPPSGDDPAHVIDLLSLIRTEVARVAQRFADRKFLVGGEVALVTGDEKALRTAIAILLEKAAERSQIGDLVEARVSRVGANAVISVADQGPSLREAELARLFELFSIDDIDHHSNAVDLDRPICASIIRRHGGNVIARTRSNDGLTCQISLPLRTEEFLRDVG